MTTKVLVTGAAGYIGSILCEHLLGEGYQVIALDNLMYGQASSFHLCANRQFEFVFGDARDERLIQQLLCDVDVVIPLAAIVGAPACDRNPLLAQSINLDAVAMLNRLRSHQQLVVYPNTNSGYGVGASDTYCAEDSPLHPISLYGKTKVEAEQLLLDSPNTVTLRLATVFGASPRMRIDLLVNHFTYEAVTRGYLVVYQREFRRNYVHIRDVADCMVYCIQNADRMVGRPYNVGLDSANLSKEELAMAIQKHVPGFYVHFAEVGEDPDKRDYIVSNQRLQEAGFKACRTLDQGIQELLKAYRTIGRGLYANV